MPPDQAVQKLFCIMYMYVSCQAKRPYLSNISNYNANLPALSDAFFSCTVEEIFYDIINVAHIGYFSWNSIINAHPWHNHMVINFRMGMSMYISHVNHSVKEVTYWYFLFVEDWTDTVSVPIFSYGKYSSDDYVAEHNMTTWCVWMSSIIFVPIMIMWPSILSIS